MDSLRAFFDERRSEIDAYLTLLDAVSLATQAGLPRIEETGVLITAEQQKILFSTVYLQLYNLVEATVSRCVERLSTAACEESKWVPGDLSNELRREWIRTTAGTHQMLSDEKRLRRAVDLFEQLVPERPVPVWKVERGGGGNWDDGEIERVSRRLGLRLRLKRATREAAKRPVRNDRGSLSLVKDLRNNLAHGSISFVECGANATVSDLRVVAASTINYLSEVVDSFSTAIDAYEFLRPERRPLAAGVQ